jgi:hypothetical protein
MVASFAHFLLLNLTSKGVNFVIKQPYLRNQLSFGLDSLYAVNYTTYFNLRA